MAEIDRLTDFLIDKHPGATLLLAGSFARGTPTPFSDYDVLAIQTTGREPFRTAYEFEHRLVEVFCHTEGSILHWIAENTKVRKKSMASMLLDSKFLRGETELHTRLRAFSKVAIDALIRQQQARPPGFAGSTGAQAFGGLGL